MEYVREIEETIEVGDEDYTVAFTRITRTVVDPNYGADADGRRGERRVFIDEDYYEDLTVDGKKIEDYPDDLQDDFREAVEHWMNENSPVCE